MMSVLDVRRIASFGSIALVNLGMPRGLRPYGVRVKAQVPARPRKKLFAQTTTRPERQPQPRDARPHLLYLLYDEDGALLYVGITVDWRNRFNGHSHASPWWGRVSRLEIEWFSNWFDASAAEKLAIATNQPLFNRTHSRRRPWL